MTSPAVPPMRVRAPDWLAEHAREFAESGQTPATPRPAATVILLREAQAGFEVYTQRRAATMAFAPSMYAFPGGSVDPRDAEHGVGWAGPSTAWWSARLGLDEAAARAVVCAAVRELFEECGVLLAGANESTVVGDVTGADWERARQSLLAREVALVELLGSLGLAVRSDLLVPSARWLTPEPEARRYDTYFFLARLPADQATRDVGGEADHTAWLRPDEAAELPMLPPTRHTLTGLAAYATVAEAIAACDGRDLTAPVMPRIEITADGAFITMP